MIKLGFIGCGRMANYHAEVLKSLDAKIISVCGRENSEKAKEFAKKYNISEVYKNWNELAQNSAVDILWITTTPEATEDIIIQLIKTNHHIFVEKPVALNSKKIEDAILAEKASKKKVFIGMNRRFYDFIPELEKIISTNPLKAVEINLPEQTEYRNINPEQLSKLWFTSSIHEIDLIYYLLGPLKIDSLFRENNSKNINGLLKSEKYNIPVHLIANWNVPQKKSIKFYFEKKLIELCPIETMKLIEGITRIEPAEKNQIAKFKPKITKEITTSAYYKPGLHEQDKAVVNYLEGIKYDKRLANLNQSHEVTELIENIVK